MPAIAPEILKQVKQLELRTRGLVASLFAGEYRSVFRGQGMEFAEVRAYEPGDDYRSIDWNVSARLASPYVKTFTEERELTLMLLVDQSGSTRFGEPRTKAALAVEVAAVLALAAARHNDRVGALLFADEVERVVPPAKGRRHALRVIRDLVAFQPVGKRTNLATSLLYAAELLWHRSIVVLLSDFFDANWEEPLRRLAAADDLLWWWYALAPEPAPMGANPRCDVAARLKRGRGMDGGMQPRHGVVRQSPMAAFTRREPDIDGRTIAG